MNSTRIDADDEEEGQEERFSDIFERSDTRNYFAVVEKIFLDLRGSPLTLNSSKDYQLSRRWFEAGVPLELIRSTIREVIERRQREGKDKVLSLTFVKRAVARAWKRQQELMAPGAAAPAEPAFDVPALLTALVALLPEALPGRAELVERISALGEDPEVVEMALMELDSELLELGWQRLGVERQAELEQRLDAARKKLAQRLSTEEVERAGDRLREQILREQLELPVLSLFAVD